MIDYEYILFFFDIENMAIQRLSFYQYFEVLIKPPNKQQRGENL